MRFHTAAELHSSLNRLLVHCSAKKESSSMRAGQTMKDIMWYKTSSGRRRTVWRLDTAELLRMSAMWVCLLVRTSSIVFLAASRERVRTGLDGKLGEDPVTENADIKKYAVEYIFMNIYVLVFRAFLFALDGVG